jgi:hypothetical protein
LPSLDLIVHLDHVLAGRADNPSRIKHHAGDGVVVGVGVVDRPCSEIPYL